MGTPHTFILVLTNEPATTDLEHEFVQTYPSTWKDGYFQIEVPDSQQRETASAPAEETAHPSKPRIAATNSRTNGRASLNERSTPIPKAGVCTPRCFAWRTWTTRPEYQREGLFCRWDY